MYEFYVLKTEIGKHQYLHGPDIQHALLISKDDTLGPRFIDSYVAVSLYLSNKPYFEVREYLRKQTEEEFIDHLNENVGLECLIKKEEVPEEIYKRIKNESKNKISLVEI